VYGQFIGVGIGRPAACLGASGEVFGLFVDVSSFSIAIGTIFAFLLYATTPGNGAGAFIFVL
jgi:hypothetical protein